MGLTNEGKYGSIGTMIETFYTDGYSADARTQSMSKLPLIAGELVKERIAELVKPLGVDVIDALRRLHNPVYFDAFNTGSNDTITSSNGFRWTSEIRNAVLWSNAGMLAGAESALKYGGVVANLGGGYHHAKWGRGDAYCTFNGLALVAQENPTAKVFVLDCDEHQGDGTKEFTNKLENLYNYSIFGTRMERTGLLAGRSWDREVCGWDMYESALWEGLTKISEVEPDIILYQAGVDCYKNDGMGRAGLRSSDLIARDTIVFEFARDAGIPILFVMAGGYGTLAVNHHIQTFRSAVAVFG